MPIEDEAVKTEPVDVTVVDGEQVEDAENVLTTGVAVDEPGPEEVEEKAVVEVEGDGDGDVEESKGKGKKRKTKGKGKGKGKVEAEVAVLDEEKEDKDVEHSKVVEEEEESQLSGCKGEKKNLSSEVEVQQPVAPADADPSPSREELIFLLANSTSEISRLENLTLEYKSSHEGLTSHLSNLSSEYKDLKNTHEFTAQSLETTSTELADLQKGHAFISASKGAIEAELREERKKRESAEETVEMLRGQLETARRALGTLKQQDSAAKRSSMVGLGVEGGDLSALGFTGGGQGTNPNPDQRSHLPPIRSAKRQSLLLTTPTSGSSEARLSRRVSAGHPFHDVDGNGQEVLSDARANAGLASTANVGRVVSGGLKELRLGSSSTTAHATATAAANSSPSLSSPSVSSNHGDIHLLEPSPTLDPPTTPGNASKQDKRLPGLPSLSGWRGARVDEEYAHETERDGLRPTRPVFGNKRSSTSNSNISASAGALGFDNDQTGIDLTQSPPRALMSTSSFRDDDRSIDEMSTNLAVYEEELSSLRQDVSSLRAQLAQSQEARVASEDCLKALREFVSTGHGDSNAVGLEGMSSGHEGIKLPPLPTDRDVDEMEQEDDTGTAAAAVHAHDTTPTQSAKKTSGWGRLGTFGSMWKSPGVTAQSMDNNGGQVQPSFASNISDAGDTPCASAAASGSSPVSTRMASLFPVDSNQKATSSMNSPGAPLSNFVSSWSRGIATSPSPAPALTPESGSPAIQGPTTPSQLGGMKRGFSFFSSKAGTTTSAQEEKANATKEESEDGHDAPSHQPKVDEFEDGDENTSRRVEEQSQADEVEAEIELNNLKVGESGEGNEFEETSDEVRAEKEEGVDEADKVDEGKMGVAV